MPQITVDKCNFMNAGVTFQFREGEFRFEGVRTLKPEEGKQVILMPTSEISYLNRNRSQKMSSGSTDTNIFKYVFYVGTFLAFIIEFFKVADVVKKTKHTKRIIVKFVNGRMISGYTDLETFFAVQNAWLDNRPRIKTNLETNQ